MRDLLKAGVPVAAGGDSMYEPSGPMGHADPLSIASHLVAARLTPAEAITAVSSAGRQIMRLPGVALGPGSPADLVAIRAPDLVSAVTSGTADRIVLRGGRVVARSVLADFARPELAAARSVWNLTSSVCRPVTSRPAGRQALTAHQGRTPTTTAAAGEPRTGPSSGLAPLMAVAGRRDHSRRLRRRCGSCP